MSNQIRIALPFDSRCQIERALSDGIAAGQAANSVGQAARLMRLLMSWQLPATPAVAEDQPEPRVWRKGDDEPVDKPMVTDNEGKRWEWRAQGDKPILSYANQWHCLDDTGHVWWEALVTCYGPLSEVLADSEQATR